MTLPPTIEPTPEAQGRLQECETFLASVPPERAKQLRETLERSLATISRLAGDSTMRLTSDFAPLSFGFSGNKWRGGVIFHGPHDGYGSGSAPTFSVSLNNIEGWEVHT